MFDCEVLVAHWSGELTFIPMIRAQYAALATIHIRVYDSAMKSGVIIVALQKDGWYEVATKGSHVQFKHPEKPGRVTVPHPKRDIPIGTLQSIEKQAGLKLR